MFKMDAMIKFHGNVINEKSEIKTIIEYGTNSDGQPIKITRKVKVTTRAIRIKKSILDRRRGMAKFGDLEGFENGPEAGTTIISPEIFNLNLDIKRPISQLKPIVPEVESESTMTAITCRKCGKIGHYTSKCQQSESLENETKSPEKSTRYVPVHSRHDGTFNEPKTKLFIDNLSIDATKEDLYELFGAIGKVENIYIIRDRDTGTPRGTAFVTYQFHEDAENAIKRLNGHRYDHLILNVDWSKAEVGGEPRAPFKKSGGFRRL
jgi:translation initiation factor 3 subunit G